MKKILLLAFVLIMAMTAVYAANGQASGETAIETGQSTTVPVKFDLGENGNVKWEIGFTNETSEKNLSYGNVKSATSIDLVLDENTMTGGINDESPVAVYWILTGGQKVRISLAAEGAMKGTDSKSATHYINWETSWTPKKNADGALAEDTEVTLGSNAASLAGQPVDYTTAKSVFDRSATVSASEKGLVPLTITTQDVSDAATVEYSSSLTLKIEPVETT